MTIKNKIAMVLALSAMVAAPVIGVKYESDLHNVFVAAQNIKSSTKDLSKNLSVLKTVKSAGSVSENNLEVTALKHLNKDLSTIVTSIRTKGLQQDLADSAPASKILNQQFANDIVSVQGYITSMIWIAQHCKYAGKVFIQEEVNDVNKKHPEYAGAVSRITKEIDTLAPQNIATKVNGPGGLRYNMHVYYYYFDGTLNSDGTAHLSHGDTYVHAWNAHVEIGAKSGSKYGQGIYMDKDHPLQVKISASMQHTVSFQGNIASLQLALGTVGTTYKSTAFDIDSKGPASDPTVWGQLYRTNATTNVQTSERVGGFAVYNWKNKKADSVAAEIETIFGSIVGGVAALASFGIVIYLIGLLLF